MTNTKVPFGPIDLQEYFTDWKTVLPVRFSAAHTFFYQRNEIEQQVWFVQKNPIATMERQAKAGPAVTLIYSGIPFVSFGLIYLSDTVAECWMTADEQLLKHFSRPFLRRAHKLFTELGDKTVLNRIQFTITKRNVIAIRFAKWLNFNTEGTLRNFNSDGSDCLMMSRIYNHG